MDAFFKWSRCFKRSKLIPNWALSVIISVLLLTPAVTTATETNVKSFYSSASPEKNIPFESAMEEILSAHHDATGQAVAVFHAPKQGSLELKHTIKKAFSRLPKGNRNLGQNRVLIALFPDDSKAFVHVDFGLDHLISTETADQIELQTLDQIQKLGVEKALFNAALLVLEKLESPILTSGVVQSLLEKQGLASLNSTEEKPHSLSSFWFMGFFLGVLAVFFTFYFILNSETHFTSDESARMNGVHLFFLEWKTRLRNRSHRTVSPIVGGISGRLNATQ